MIISPCLYGTQPFRVIRQTELPDYRKFLKMQSPLVEVSTHLLQFKKKNNKLATFITRTLSEFIVNFRV